MLISIPKRENVVSCDQPLIATCLSWQFKVFVFPSRLLRSLGQLRSALGCKNRISLRTRLEVQRITWRWDTIQGATMISLAMNHSPRINDLWQRRWGSCCLCIFREYPSAEISIYITTLLVTSTGYQHARHDRMWLNLSSPNTGANRDSTWVGAVYNWRQCFAAFLVHEFYCISLFL